MSEESRLRENLCGWARSMFDRGLTGGASGNISLKLEDGRTLVTPTGSSFRNLDPASLSELDADGRHIGGMKPTKELALHRAFYETRSAGAVVHLHSSHATAVSALPEIDPDNVLLPVTAYSIMRLGRVKLLPYFMPGDPAMGEAVRGLAGKHSAVLLANHGPVVAARDLDAAVFAMEELEETAKLMLMLHGRNPRLLTPEDVERLMERPV
ncbi:MAG: 3-oxo-tetronate 4-phosphate decarboxylase [Alphaproteobacteria bacterium]|nr:3-oxo-tetronate 4-phosphate decarboxylase [Alphaproteobacteria bacterium]